MSFSKMFALKLHRYCLMMVNRTIVNHPVENLGLKVLQPIRNSSSSSSPGQTMFNPSNFDKWILVWMKKFPKGQVPDKIPVDLMYQVKSRARVKAANYMTVLAVIMCIVTVFMGKKARESGDSIQQRNQEWHRKINEEYKAQQLQKTES